MRYLFYSLILLVSLASCERAFLGQDAENSPENNFEIFWNDLDQHYSLFQARGWNWDSIYSVYRPQVSATTTDAELFTIFKEMIAYLDDSHTAVGIPSQAFFASGSELDSIVELEFSMDVLRNNYLENITEISVPEVDEDYLYAKVKSKDIGYIYLRSIGPFQGEVIDEVLQNIGHHKAIVLDIRNNLGGSDVVAKTMAARFSNEEKFAYTVQERNGPEHGDFTAKIPYHLVPDGPVKFTKPVILLTDRVTVSAAEILALYLNPLDHVTQIGDTTAGDFSDTSMRRFLPNGWQYQYSIMLFLLPNGQNLDGLGHVPDVLIRNTVQDIQAGTDRVLEEAIQYLFDTYGIE